MLNKYEWGKGYTEQQKEDSASRARWSYAYYHTDCPECGVSAGYYCQAPSGRKKQGMGPHRSRNMSVPKHIGLVKSI